MKKQNRWEELFEGWLDLTDFTLIKYNDGWGLYDQQGGNLGDIQSDRFENATQIVDRMEIYINDYICEDLTECWDAENNNAEFPYGYPESLEEWLKYRELMPNNQYEMDLCEMMSYHTNEINLENVFYESEEE